MSQYFQKNINNKIWEHLKIRQISPIYALFIAQKHKISKKNNHIIAKCCQTSHSIIILNKNTLYNFINLVEFIQSNLKQIWQHKTLDIVIFSFILSNEYLYISFSMNIFIDIYVILKIIIQKPAPYTNINISIKKQAQIINDKQTQKQSNNNMYFYHSNIQHFKQQLCIFCNMYENKIEKFTDNLFFKSKSKNTKTATQNLTLNFKSLALQKKNNSPYIQSSNQDGEIVLDVASNIKSRSISQNSKQNENFREAKKKIGLNKTDIDKLELMCMDLRADDYLTKLIQIHQQQKALKDQADINIVNNQRSMCSEHSQPDKLNSQFLYTQQNQLKIDPPSQYRLVVTQCDQRPCQNIKQSDQNVKNSRKKIHFNFKNKSQCRSKSRSRSKSKSKNLNRNNNSNSNVNAKQTDKNFNKTVNTNKNKDNNNKNNSKSKNKNKNKNTSINKDMNKNLNNNLTQQQKYQNSNKNKQFLFVAKTSKQSLKLSQQIQQNQANKNKNKNAGVSQSINPSISNIIDADQNNQNEDHLKTPLYGLDQINEKQDNKTQHQLTNIYEEVYYQQRQISHSKILEQICYAQIGKRMITVTEKQISRQFFKVNLHIRSYIMKSIVSYIQYLAQFSPNSIFILPNQRAIHYEPNQKPPILSNYLQHTKYIQIIKKINHIIQKNIFKQKYKESQSTYWPYILLFMSFILLIMMLLTIFCHDQGFKNAFMICTGFFICVMMVILVGYSFYCYGTNIEFVPACQAIQQEIQAYFRFVNGKMENDLQWILGQSFFWVQVKIRSKQQKQKYNQNYFIKKKKQKSFEQFQRNRHKQCTFNQQYRYQRDKIMEQY